MDENLIKASKIADKLIAEQDGLIKLQEKEINALKQSLQLSKDLIKLLEAKLALYEVRK